MVALWKREAIKASFPNLAGKRNIDAVIVSPSSVAHPEDDVYSLFYHCGGKWHHGWSYIYANLPWRGKRIVDLAYLYSEKEFWGEEE